MDDLERASEMGLNEEQATKYAAIKAAQRERYSKMSEREILLKWCCGELSEEQSMEALSVVSGSEVDRVSARRRRQLFLLTVTTEEAKQLLESGFDGDYDVQRESGVSLIFNLPKEDVRPYVGIELGSKPSTTRFLIVGGRHHSRAMEVASALRGHPADLVIIDDISPIPFATEEFNRSMLGFRDPVQSVIQSLRGLGSGGLSVPFELDTDYFMLPAWMRRWFEFEWQRPTFVAQLNRKRRKQLARKLSKENGRRIGASRERLLKFIGLS